MTPDVSILVVNWNTREMLLSCLGSAYEHAGPLSVEVWVADNGSVDGSVEAVGRAFPRARVLPLGENRGYGAANNAALEHAAGRTVLFLNTDALLTPGALPALVAFLDRTPGAGCVTPQLVHPDGSLQNSFDNVPTLATELLSKAVLRRLLPGRFPSKAASFEGPTEVEAPIGASLLVRKDVLDEVGGFDERFFFFLEETDLCLRIRRSGRACYLLPDVRVVHGKGRTKARRPARAWVEYYRSNYAFFRKHRGRAAALALRAGKCLRLPVNLALNLAGTALTLGRHERFRRKTLTYAALLWWHLRLCPASGGLRPPR